MLQDCFPVDLTCKFRSISFLLFFFPNGTVSTQNTACLRRSYG